MFYPRADADLSLYAHPLAADEPWTGLRSVDYNKALPPLRNAIVSITLDNETKTDTIRSMQSAALFKNIPHRFLKNDVKSPDTTFYYVFAKDNVAKNKLDDQNKEGRIVGYYQIGGHQKIPFDGYMEELERKEKDQRRWKISISAHDSVFNSERITGIFIDHIIHLSKWRLSAYLSCVCTIRCLYGSAGGADVEERAWGMGGNLETGVQDY